MKKIHSIKAIYFSPVGSTKKYALTLARKLSQEINVPVEEFDITLPQNRKKIIECQENDITILTLPVYAGRIPNKIMPYVRDKIKGVSSKIVLLSVYGNRHYDQALEEMANIAKSNGFIPVAAAALVANHAFSKKIAYGRPTESDLHMVMNFASQIKRKTENEASLPLNIGKENIELFYYTPLGINGEKTNFLKAVPITKEEKCDSCGVCQKHCPMGSIDRDDYKRISGICIKCHSCINRCPKEAKFFEDDEFLSHKRRLENDLNIDKEILFFI